MNSRVRLIKIARSSLLFLFLFIGLKGYSAKFWRDTSPSLDWTAPSVLQLTNFRALDLNYSGLWTDISNDNHDSISWFDFPHPDGGFIQFIVKTNNLIPPILQAKYSGIRSYTPVAPADRSLRIQLDFGSTGLHAMVLSPEGQMFLDPGISGRKDSYISYWKSDATQTGSFQCEMEDPILFPSSMNSSQNAAIASTPLFSPKIKTYRLAVATTGEYSSFHGGTKASVLSAITTTVNRVNGIFERDLGIHFVFAEKMDTLFFFDAVGDPFNNYNSFNLALENQIIIDSYLGDTLYDIGHNFGTGAGGFAPGLACSFSTKAQGVTGSQSPIGDPFDIDYVCHEIGHQFSANHTQNNSCNRANSAAFEPGSASTIMGYAGICAPNIQSNSDTYFHVHSIFEISNYTEVGAGNTCPTISATNGNAPTLTIDQSGFLIPMSTPFRLIGAGMDLDGDSLTYTWEQYNLGPSGSPFMPTANAPSFRSFLPKRSPERFFPKFSSILSGNNVIGEVLPDYGRNLRFRLTARDNNISSPGISYAQVDFDVDIFSGPFELTFPNSLQHLTSNFSYPIQWAVNGTDGPDVNCQLVNIYYSSDGGQNFNDTLVLNTPNDGEFIWDIGSGMETLTGRIWIEAADNIFLTISEEFEIKSSGIGLAELQNNIALYPNPVQSGKELTLVSNSFNNAELSIIWIDMLGKQVEKAHYSFSETNNSIQISTTRLDKGVYELLLITKDSKTSKRIIVH